MLKWLLLCKYVHRQCHLWLFSLLRRYTHTSYKKVFRVSLRMLVGLFWHLNLGFAYGHNWTQDLVPQPHPSSQVSWGHAVTADLSAVIWVLHCIACIPRCYLWYPWVSKLSWFSLLCFWWFFLSSSPWWYTWVVLQMPIIQLLFNSHCLRLGFRLVLEYGFGVHKVLSLSLIPDPIN